MVDPENVIQRSVNWFQRSGVMRPSDGFWGVAERVVLLPGNSAREEIDRDFPFQTRLAEEAVVLEARRPDCNVEVAYLFDRTAAMLGRPELRDVAGNIIDFLFHRSALYDRRKGSVHEGLWQWAHPAPRTTYWIDDMAWVITILCKMGKLGRSELIPFAVDTARRLHVLVRAYFDDARTSGLGHEPSENVVLGLRMNPHWIGLLTMAFAHAQSVDSQTDYSDIVHEYYSTYALGGPPSFDKASRQAARRYPWSISEYAYLALAASVCMPVFSDDAIRSALTESAAILCRSQSPRGHFPAEHYEAPASRTLVDLIYTQNWATLGLQHAARVLDDDACRSAVTGSLSLLSQIQDPSPQPWLEGCWRGMYDMDEERWGGGDLSEGGANSIYSGWTNAPIALSFLFEATGESLFP